MSSPAKVIINDRVLFLPLTGVGHYVNQLLRAFRDTPAPMSVQPFLSGWIGPPRRDSSSPSAHTASRSVQPHGGQSPPYVPKPRRPRPGWLRRMAQAAYGSAFSLAARRYDLYHEPNHVPIACGVPTVTTVHDLSAIVHPEWHPADRIRWYEQGFAAGVRQTRRFIAASEFTKAEMVRVLGLDPGRIDVTYQAPRPGFTRRPPDEARRCRAAHGLPEQFLLFVGTLEPRKNVAGLLESFAGVPAGVRQRCPLVLAGGFGWKMDALDEQIGCLGLRDTVRFIGYVHDSELAALYSTCRVLVWPTLYEGFGLPPLEALACGCPVMVSNTSSLPEVVGDAGVLLDPLHTAAWAEAMRRMIEDEAWRADWAARGEARAGLFSWARCAEQTLDCYRKALP